jgi:hypothetical protein
MWKQYVELNLQNITVMNMSEEKAYEERIKKRIKACKACKQIFKKAKKENKKVYICNECDHIYPEDEECSCREEEDKHCPDCDLNCSICTDTDCVVRKD